MATNGFEGFYIETRDYTATAAFWASLGFAPLFESEHASGQWQHPSGGPYVFINETADGDLITQPILGVTDSTAFAPGQPVDYLRPWEPQHWGVVEAVIRDPDGREVSLQAPLPQGAAPSDADAHHDETHGGA